MSELDWDGVRFFLTAAREGSLVGAARALSVKHTTVGRRLDELEDALGAKLFRRTTEGLQLTTVGEAMRPIADEIERAMRRIAETANAETRVAGVVQLSLSEGFAGFIVKRLGALREAHPALVVDVLIDNASADLARGEADIAIRMGPITAPSLICRRLGTFGWSLYAEAAYAKRVALDRAPRSAWDIIGYDSALSHAPGARWIESNVDAARVVLRCNSLIAALNAAIGGVGVAALPCVLGGSEPALVRVTSDVIGTRDGFLVFHPDRQGTARVRAVLDYLLRVVADNERMISG